ncbi:MAG: autotransporter outer membrane beta-barrel domain-containing protein, partial [Mailhella sp.]|nr:autotransporter outer membrane beta-barrel domain-containing protein [Mailhella sp.]
VGYGFGNHEVEMGIPVAGVNKAKADIDTSAFTADLRAEYLLKTPYVDILPHAGIRYTALKTEAHDLKANGSVLNSVESDTQNIVQFPVGVTLSKDFDLAGWNVKPMADVSIIPAAGDKKATTKVNFSGLDAWDSVNTRVMDSTSWAGTIGVQAEKGNMTFGLNYGVQASSNETDQNIQVKFGWKF